MKREDATEVWVGLWLPKQGERIVAGLDRTFCMAISLCQLTFIKNGIKPEDHLFVYLKRPLMELAEYSQVLGNVLMG